MRYSDIQILLPALFVAFAAHAASPLPDDVREAVRQVRTNAVASVRQPYFLLEQFTPKAAGEAEQCRALAALLAEAAGAADTTPLGRTILCQHLARVAGAAETPLLRKLLADPAATAAARIALGEVVGAPPPAEPVEVYRAEAAAAQPATRVAGLSSLARYYPKAALPVCVKALGDTNAVVSATAMRLVGRLDGAALAGAVAGFDAARQALALDVLAECKVGAARGVVTGLVASPDETVRAAAIRALGVLGDKGSVAVLAEAGAEAELAQLTAPGVDRAIVAGIAAGKPAARVTLLNAAVARGGPGLTPVLLEAVRTADETVQKAALKVLGRTGDVAAYPQLVALLGAAGGQEAENAVRQMGRRLANRQARLAPLLDPLKDAKAPVATQAAVVRVLAPLGGEDALAPVRERLAAADATLRDAAVRSLAEWPDATAAEALRSVAADPAASVVHRTLAARALERLASAVARRDALVYLDCGAAAESTGADGARLRVVGGKPWTWTDEPAGTVAFDGDRLTVEATGLKPDRAYQLGLTWWDYDANGRAQSVWVNGQPLIGKTVLPAWQGKQEGAATLTAVLPASAVRGGRAAIEFRREAASNVAVGEVWLSPAPAGGAGTAAVAVAPAAAPVAPVAVPVVQANAGAAKKVLVVTGLDYPGHLWRETAPVLIAALALDKRLEVSVTEDARVLASPQLDAYAAIVLHYQNHNVPAPEGALANLKRVVEGGKGLVLVHFACGAFIDWTTKHVADDFGALAGRVWNPALRGHDPRGPFRVRIVDAAHPIMKGLADFDTDDELYTCLEGAAPIQVLAVATSKVDKKDYPMAFTLLPGQGRTFHCVLGHDVKALGGTVGALYRRGTAWAAGLEPQE